MLTTEVNDKATAESFIMINVLMNKDHPNYIRPLNHEINEVFDAAKNKAFKYGKAKRWILHDDNRNLIGRIAAFIRH